MGFLESKSKYKNSPIYSILLVSKHFHLYLFQDIIPMKKIFLALMVVGFSAVYSQPFYKSKTVPAKITKHELAFADDYAWLENYKSDEVRDWVAKENALTDLELETAKKSFSSEGKIKEYDFLSSNPLPIKKGKYFFMNFRKDKDRPASLFYTKHLADSPIELVNPYKIYKNENAYIAGNFPSRNSKYVAYKISTNGSDRHEIRFADIEKIKNLDDVLTDVKFSNVAWNGDRGIFYKKNSNIETFARDSTYKLYYHRIGKPQAEDELVFDGTKNESSIHFFTKENKLFVIETDKDEQHNTYYSSAIDTETFYLEKFLEKEAADFTMLSYAKGRIYFSSKEYGWGDVRSFDIKNRGDETILIPQIYNHLLVDVDFFEKYIVCKYKTVGKNYISIYNREGQFLRKFDAPEGMDFNIRFFDSESNDLFVSFYSYTLSFHNFRLNLETGEAKSFYSNYSKPKPTIFPLDHFETKTITYKSRDGKDIPMTIVHKKGIVLDGNNPTLLKAYGGFGTISGPNYETGLLYFLGKGGVFAYAEIRGGGEKGLAWHKDGRGLKKINTFNDFIDAAEYLIREKYTSPQKLGITGASQGGLLVGVALTQRPDLFKVAIPKVGVYDMAKFEDYTVGKYHRDEYGDPNKKEDFHAMMAYSPYHNVKDDVNYPTTLIITSENDDRVPPIHSYKFAARLQNRDAQKNPILLKTLSNSGHYGKISNYKSRTEENAEFYNFLLYHLNK